LEERMKAIPATGRTLSDRRYEIMESSVSRVAADWRAVYDTKSNGRFPCGDVRDEPGKMEVLAMPTPSMEDYLERIYKLIDEKGYARVSDIAEGLEVHPSSVTKMIQKLDKDNYLIYEKYRGLVLTNKGKKMGKRLMDRHHLLEEFLTIIGVQQDNIYKDVEGIEHHLSWDSITCIETLVEYFRRDPSRVEVLKGIRSELENE
jgi:Mn-dependent DtxR family transcriptional regulator